MIRWLPWCCVAPLLFAAVAAPQFRSDVRLVVIHATVTDRHGTFVKGLPGTAFRVFENGRRQTLSESIREDVAVSVGLLLDESGSTNPFRPRMVEAFQGMAAALKPGDEVFAGHFGMFFNVDMPPSPPTPDLVGKLAILTAPESRPRFQTATRLFDSIAAATHFVESSSRRGKQVLLLVTDGRDTASLASLKQTLANCRRSPVLIYAIGFDTGKGRKTLDEITAAAGGRAFYPRQPEELPAIALQISQEIRSQYTLTYVPNGGNADGTWNQLRVEIAGRPELQVRCRSGYYTVPVSGSSPR
jgi:VWFA-related protein